MIVAEQKPLAEIMGMVDGAKSVLILGCGTCVTVCFAGGEKEAEILASSLRMRSRLAEASMDVSHATVQRQCEWEYLDTAADGIRAADVVVSLACGVGAQAIVERFPETRMVPGLNTRFYGLPVRHGVWEERCAGCGECLLDETGGICPISRCSKSLLNGPCGGTQKGKCEVDPNTECAWYLIHERMKRLGTLDRLAEPRAPKNWRTAHDGGPGRIVREDLLRDRDPGAASSA